MSRHSRALSLTFVLLGLIACNQDSDRDDEPLIDFGDVFGGLDDIGEGSGDDPFGDGDGDGTCEFPCLFGTVCVEGQCVIPCEPACGPLAECLFGICVPVTGATCSPPCRESEVCRGEEGEPGECVPADGCEPECEDDETCLRTGACVPDDACDEDEDCAEGQRCIGGACVDPVSPDEYAPAGATGVAIEVEVPGVLLDRCCFDFNGDGLDDNALSGFELLSGILGSEPLEEAFASALEDGSLGYGFDLAETSEGRADFAIMDVSVDLDGDGEPDVEIDEIEEGDATLRITRSGLGGFGPLTQFRSARWDGVFLETSQSDLFLTLPPGALLSLDERPARYRVQRARARAAFRIEGSGLESVDEELLEIGGAIAAQDIVDTFNEAVPDCVCVSDDAPDLVRIDEGEEGLMLSCNPRVSLVLCAGAEGACGQLPLLCESLPELSELLPWDVDLSGDGRFDAASIGLRMTVTPATPLQRLTCTGEAGRVGSART